VRGADRPAGHRRRRAPAGVATAFRPAGRRAAQLPHRGRLGQPAARRREGRPLGFGRGALPALGGGSLRGPSARGPHAVLVARHGPHRKGRQARRLPDRPLRRRPHGPGGRRRTVHRPRRLGSHGRAAAPEVRPPRNGGCGPAARQFAGLPRSLDQRPQGGRRLPRSGPLAARQTLAVGDLRRRALPARRRERGGDLARTGMVQTRHVRPLAARRALHRTARAGADRHADRRHVADRLPHGPLLARGAERLPRHGVVERPRLRRRGGRCAAQPALDGSGRSGRARLAAGDRTRQARPPRNAPDGPARPRAGAAAAARTARNGPRRLAARLRTGRHRMAGGRFRRAAPRRARRDRVQRRDGARREPRRPAAARHLHRLRRPQRRTLHQQVQPPRLPLRQGARTGGRPAGRISGRWRSAPTTVRKRSSPRRTPI